MSDPFISNVALLLSCDGTNGSTTFLDGGPANKTVTAATNAQISTTSPKWGTGCYTATIGYLTVPTASDTDMGSSDFTVEGWAKTTNTSTLMILYTGRNGTGSDRGPTVFIQSGGLRGFCGDASGTLIGDTSAVGTIPSATWFHWAYVRNGSNFLLFLNGTQVGTTVTSSTACGGGTNPSIGRDPGTGGREWNGQLDDIRVTKGVARYTSNFTAPTAAFDPFVAGPSGTAAVTQAKNTTAASGGVLVSGTGAVTQAPNATAIVGIVGTPNTGVLTQNPNVVAAVGSLGVFGSAAVTSAPNYALATGYLDIDPNFAKVVWLAHFDATPFTDFSSYNQTTTNTGGPVFIDTTNYKFGGGAWQNTTQGNATSVFNSNGSTSMGTSDFTVEGWASTTTLATIQGLFSCDLGPQVQLNGNQLVAFCDDGGAGFGQISITGAISANTFFSWAYVRSGSTFYLFVNGTLVTTATSSAACGTFGSCGVGYITGQASSGSSGHWTGQIDEVRVTKGVARYTASYTPSTRPFGQGQPPARLAVETVTLPQVSQVANVNTGASRVLATPGAGDPYFNSVALLLHGDVAGVDSSSAARALNPSYKQGGPSSTQAKFGAGAFEMSLGDTIQLTSASSAFDFLSNDLTVETWFRMSDPSVAKLVLTTDFSSFTIDSSRAQGIAPTVRAKVHDPVAGTFTSVLAASAVGAQIKANTWHHVALVRSGGTLALYFDGLQVGTAAFTGTIQSSYPFSAGVDKPTFGFVQDASGTTTGWLGWFDDIRITNGAGRYTATRFQVPTAAFPNVRGLDDPLRIAQSAAATAYYDRSVGQDGDALYNNVSALFHGDVGAADTSVVPYTHSYQDNSHYALTGRGSNAPTVTKTGAFGGLAIFADRGNFAQTDQFIPVAKSSFTTVEFRVNFPSINLGYFYSSVSSGLQLGFAGGGLHPDSATGYDPVATAPYVLELGGIPNDYAGSGGSFSGGVSVRLQGVTNFTPGVWYHIALVRNGSSISIYVNGVLDATMAYATTTDFLDPDALFGDTHRGINYAVEYALPLYVEEYRFTNGIARYTGQFTPPSVAFPDTGPAVLPTFAQTATVASGGGGVATRYVAATQTLPAFSQAASISSQSQRSVAGAQQLDTFILAQSLYGQGGRFLGATQQLPPLGQVATISYQRTLDADIIPQRLAPIGQVATITTTRTVAAAQQILIGQAATVAHAADNVVGVESFTFGQAATAQALLKLTAGQILLPPTQAATASRINRLVGAQLLDTFVPTTLIEGGFISASPRGYRVRPEARTVLIAPT